MVLHFRGIVCREEIRGKTMEIRVLNYFLTVVKEGSITKAADVLHMTQPTLSRQLSAMEEELGVKLFKRGSRKITLTEQGIQLKSRRNSAAGGKNQRRSFTV